MSPFQEIQYVVSAVISGFVALVFILAAVHKITDFDAFRNNLNAYRLIPEGSAQPVSYGLASAEILASVLIVAPISRTYGLALAIALLTLYSLAVAINLLRGRAEIACGCDDSEDTITWWLVVRNSSLAAATLWSLALSPTQFVYWTEDLTALLMGACLAVLSIASGRLFAFGRLYAYPIHPNRRR